MEENFKDHPQTIGEIKSDKTGKAVDWTPRDMLISVLREIDRGEINPCKMVLVMAEVDDEADKSRSRSLTAGTNTGWEALGLLTEAILVKGR